MQTEFVMVEGFTPTTNAKGKFMAKKEFQNIGRVIKQARMRMGVSQGFVATNIDYKNGQFISNIERGLCSIPDDKIKPLAVLLNIKPEAIIEAMVEDYRHQLYQETK